MITHATNPLNPASIVDSLPARTPQMDAPPPEAVQDQFSTDQTKQLIQMLAVNPAVRSEVVARARSLALDPSYPPNVVVKKISDLLLNAKDHAGKIN